MIKLAHIVRDAVVVCVTANCTQRLTDKSSDTLLISSRRYKWWQRVRQVAHNDNNSAHLNCILRELKSRCYLLRQVAETAAVYVAREWIGAETDQPTRRELDKKQNWLALNSCWMGSTLPEQRWRGKRRSNSATDRLLLAAATMQPLAYD